MKELIPLRPLRINDDLYYRIVEIAKIENRSFNKETAHILELYAKEFEKEYFRKVAQYKFY